MLCINFNKIRNHNKNDYRIRRRNIQRRKSCCVSFFTSLSHKVICAFSKISNRHPPPNALKNEITVPLILPKDIRVDIHMQIMIGYENA